jgi:AcrR family transcriptional regulator
LPSAASTQPRWRRWPTLAGIANGTLYRYFPAKVDLFAEVFRLVSQREVDVMAEVAQADGSAWERMQQALRVFVLRAIQARGLAYALIAEPVDPAVDFERLKLRQAYAEVLIKLLQQGMCQRRVCAATGNGDGSVPGGRLGEALVGPLAPGDKLADDEQQVLVDGILQFCMRAIGGVVAE